MTSQSISSLLDVLGGACLLLFLVIMIAAGALSGCDTNPTTANPRVTTYCDHGNRVYLWTDINRGAIAVVPRDPTCEGIQQP